MADLFSSMIHRRIVNDISAIDEAGHDFERMVKKRVTVLPHHGLGNRAALLDMLELLGIEYSNLTEGDDILNEFKDILSSNGYGYTITKLEGKWWKSSFGDMLGVLKSTGTFVPIYHHHGRYQYIRQKENGTKEIVRINRKTSGNLDIPAYHFYRTLPHKSLTMKDFLAFIPKCVPYFHLGYVLLLSLLCAILIMGLPYATKLIFDQVIPSGKSEGIWTLAIVLLNITLMTGLLSLVRNKIFLGITNILTVNAQASLFDRIFRLKTDFFRKKSTGSITSEIFGVADACDCLSEGLVTVAFTFIISLAFVIQIGIFSHFSAISYVIIFIQGLNILCIYAGYKIHLTIKMKRIPAISHYRGVLYNLLDGIRKIKTNGAEARAFRLWASEYKNTDVVKYLDAVLPELPGTFTLLSILMMVILIPSTAMSVSDFAAFFTAFCGLNRAVSQMGLYTTEFTYILPMLEQIRPILEAEPEAEESAKTVRELYGNINITNLSFRYNTDTPYIFDGLNLQIKAGEYVAIVGQSGCGKSTLLRLLLGFEVPQRGTIFYDQYNLSSVKKSSLRQHLGACLQDGRLFSGTVIDNIKITNPYATDEEVWEALRIAALDEEVRELKGGLYHKLDATGQGLSGGQRQRILIARAVLNHPSVLFFDEATSALDNISQAKVIDNLGKIRCTRITIAHRLSTIKDCDRIIVLDKGKVAEEGTFEELMAKGGLFADIASRQLL